jgi:cytochrome c
VGSLASSTPKVTVGSYWPYATTLFDYIRRAMPYPDSGRLSNDEVYAVTAYLLYANGIIEADAILNQVTLPQVNMPNREGFYWAEGR